VPLYAGTAYFRQDESHLLFGCFLVVPVRRFRLSRTRTKTTRRSTLLESGVSAGGKVPVGQLRRHGETRGGQPHAQVRRKCAVQHPDLLLPELSPEIIVRENQTGAWDRSRPTCNSGFAQGTRADEFGGLSSLRRPVTKPREEEGHESADSGPDAACAECNARVTRDQHFVFAVRIYEQQRARFAIAGVSSVGRDRKRVCCFVSAGAEWSLQKRTLRKRARRRCAKEFTF